MESAQIGVTAAPEIEIRPPRRWGDLRLGELWEFRELLYFLFKRELQVRYKQSALGVTWAILQPIVMAAVFSLFFGVLIKLPAPADIPYPLFALSGLVPWLFFSQAVSLASTSLVADASLLTKIYFPRLAVPLAKVSALVLDLCVAFVVLFAITIAYGQEIPLQVLLVPAFMALAVIAALGLGGLFAAINVKYRDVTVAIPLLLQIMLFISPIIYASSEVPGSWKYVYALNPMVTVIEGLRWSLLGSPDPDLGVYAASVASAVAILALALIYFRRTEQFFADII